MKRSMCGVVMLAAATGLWSCNGDPTGDFRGDERVTASPSVVLLDQGSQKFVLAQLVDEQGNQQAADFEVRSVGPGIMVEEDTAFLQTTNGSEIATRSRFIVRGSGLQNSSFVLAAGGDTILVPVTVKPIEVAPSFSNPAPLQNELVTVTAPAGYSFLPDAGVTFGAEAAMVTSRAADGTSFTFVPVPPPLATLANGTIDGVEVDYIPGVSLSLPTVDSILLPVLDTLAGSDAPATAPVLAVPPPGGTSVLFNAGAFIGPDIAGDCSPLAPCNAQYYQFTITEAGPYTVSVGWNNTADLDMILCSDVACAVADFAGAGVNNPESIEFDLVPGTYYIEAALFDGDAPPRVFASITRPG